MFFIYEGCWKQMTYIKKGVRGFTNLAAMSIVASIFGYLTRTFLARYLTPSDFGLFFAILAFFTFLSAITQLGLGQGMVRFAAGKKEKSKFFVRVASFTRLGIALVVAVIVALSSSFLASSYFKDASAVLPILIGAGVFFFIITQNVIFRVYHALQKTFMMGSIGLFQKVVFFFGVFLLFFFGASHTTALVMGILFLSYVLTTVLFSLPLFTFHFGEQKEGTKDDAKALFQFGMVSFALGISHTLINQADTLVLTYFRPLEEVGIYNAVLPTVMLLYFFGKATTKVFFPMVSELWDGGEKELLKKGFGDLGRYVLLGLTPLFLSFVAFPRGLLDFLFGELFVSGALSMQILAFGAFFLVLGLIYQSVLLGIGRPGAATKILVILAVCNVIGNILLVPFFGMVGAATTTTLSHAAFLFFASRKVHAMTGASISFSLWGKTIVAGIVFYAVAVGVRSLLSFPAFVSSVIAGSIALLAYLVIAFVVRLYSIEDIYLLLRQYSK